jgi:hypothetical protein
MTPARSARAGVLPWLAVVGGVVVLGLIVRFAIGGPVGDFVGGMLYTVLIALLLTPLFTRPWLAAALALAISVAIELLQLTGFAAALATEFPPARLVFGTTFAVLDLWAAAAGALVFAVISTLLASRRARSAHAGSREQPRNEAATEAE